MMPILAEASNSDVITWQVILVITTIGANLAIILSSRRKQKREISYEFDPASKEELEKHIQADAREHEKLFSKIGGVERGMNERVEKRLTDLQKSAEDGREKLHQRINRISVGVARLCGRQGIPMPKEDDEL